jgi:hypothetical protein
MWSTLTKMSIRGASWTQWKCQKNTVKQGVGKQSQLLLYICLATLVPCGCLTKSEKGQLLVSVTVHLSETGNRDLITTMDKVADGGLGDDDANDGAQLESGTSKKRYLESVVTMSLAVAVKMTVLSHTTLPAILVL